MAMIQGYDWGQAQREEEERRKREEQKRQQFYTLVQTKDQQDDYLDWAHKEFGIARNKADYKKGYKPNDNVDQLLPLYAYNKARKSSTGKDALSYGGDASWNPWDHDEIDNEIRSDFVKKYSRTPNQADDPWLQQERTRREYADYYTTSDADQARKLSGLVPVKIENTNNAISEIQDYARKAQEILNQSAGSQSYDAQRQLKDLMGQYKTLSNINQYVDYRNKQASDSSVPEGVRALKMAAETPDDPYVGDMLKDYGYTPEKGFNGLMDSIMSASAQNTSANITQGWQNWAAQQQGQQAGVQPQQQGGDYGFTETIGRDANGKTVVLSHVPNGPDGKSLQQQQQQAQQNAPTTDYSPPKTPGHSWVDIPTSVWDYNTIKSNLDDIQKDQNLGPVATARLGFMEGELNYLYSLEAAKASQGKPNEAAKYEQLLSHPALQRVTGWFGGALKGVVGMLPLVTETVNNVLMVPDFTKEIIPDFGKAISGDQAAFDRLKARQDKQNKLAGLGNLTMLGRAIAPLMYQEQGRAYGGLLRAGVEKDTANNLSWLAGGATSTLQIAMLDTGLGQNPIVKKIVSSAVERIPGTVAKRVASGLLEYGATAATMTGQMAQMEMVNIASEELGKSLDGNNVPHATAQEIMGRMGTAIKEGAKVAAFMSLIPAVVHGVNYRTPEAIQNARIKNWKDPYTPYMGRQGDPVNLDVNMPKEGAGTRPTDFYASEKGNAEYTGGYNPPKEAAYTEGKRTYAVTIFKGDGLAKEPIIRKEPTVRQNPRQLAAGKAPLMLEEGPRRAAPTMEAARAGEQGQTTLRPGTRLYATDTGRVGANPVDVAREPLLLTAGRGENTVPVTRVGTETGRTNFGVARSEDGELTATGTPMNEEQAKILNLVAKDPESVPAVRTSMEKTFKSIANYVKPALQAIESDIANYVKKGVSLAENMNGDGSRRISNNDLWYQDFYAKNKRPPNKNEIPDLALQILRDPKYEGIMYEPGMREMEQYFRENKPFMDQLLSGDVQQVTQQADGTYQVVYASSTARPREAGRVDGTVTGARRAAPDNRYAPPNARGERVSIRNATGAQEGARRVSDVHARLSRDQANNAAVKAYLDYSNALDRKYGIGDAQRNMTPAERLRRDALRGNAEKALGVEDITRAADNANEVAQQRASGKIGRSERNNPGRREYVNRVGAEEYQGDRSKVNRVSNAKKEEPAHVTEKEFDSLEESVRNDYARAGRTVTGKMFERSRADADPKNPRREEFQAARHIAAALGIKAEFVHPLQEAADNFNGLYHDGVVYISDTAQKPAHWVLGHEVAERMKATNKEAWAQYKKVFDQEFKSKRPGAQAYLDDAASAESAFRGEDAKLTAIMDEAAADFSGDNFANPRTIKRLVEMAPNVAKVVVRTIQSMVSRIEAYTRRVLDNQAWARADGSKAAPQTVVRQYLGNAKRVERAYMGAMKKFLKEDKASAGGASERTAASLKKAHGVEFDGERMTITDPDAITMEQWGKLSAAFKRLGYDLRGAEDTKARLGIAGRKLNDDQSKAAAKVLGLIERAPQEPPTEAQANINKAVKEFGRTYDFREAGWMTSDGKLLDFSGRRDGYKGPPKRNHDHREIQAIFDDVAYTDALYKFMDEGNIRMLPEYPGFNLSQPPTKAQEAILRRFIQAHNGEMVVDMDTIGVHNSAPYTKEYDKGTRADTILSDIKRYYDEGDSGSSLVRDFHTQYSLKRSPQVDTPEFKKWFGESKVTDEAGEPLVVYHGTSKAFSAFKNKGGMGGVMGYWFSDDPAATDTFSKIKRDVYDAPQTIPAYLSLNNPKVFDEWADFVDAGQKYAGDTLEDRLKRFKSSLIRGGYDGIVIKNSRTDNGILRSDYVAFNSTQIKSATANTGAFDAGNPDIRFSMKSSAAVKRNLEAMDARGSYVSPKIADEPVRAATRVTRPADMPAPLRTDNEPDDSLYASNPELAETVGDLHAFARNFYKMAAGAQAVVERISKKMDPDKLTGEDYMQMVRGAGGTVEHINRKALVDRMGNKIGESFSGIISDIPRASRKLYNEYRQNLHNIDRMSIEENAAAAVDSFLRNNQQFISMKLDDVAALAKDTSNPDSVLARDYLSLRKIKEEAKNKPVLDKSAPQSQTRVNEILAQHPEFKGYDKRINEWNDALTHEWAVGSGLWSEEQFQHNKELYKNYIPTYRVEYAELKRRLGSNAMGNNTIRAQRGKAAVGSIREVVPLEDSFMENSNRLVRAARKNELYMALINWAGAHKKDAVPYIKFIEKDPAKDIYKTGINGTPLDAFIDAADKQNLAALRLGDWYQLTAYDAGVPVTVAVSPDVFAALDNLVRPAKSEGGMALYGLGKALTNPFKALVTGYNPWFIVRNVLRDIPNAYINSIEQNPFAYTGLLIRAAKEIATDGEHWKNFEAMGGTKDGYYDVNKGFRGNYKPGLKQAFKEGATAGEKLMAAGRSVKHGLESAGSVTESLPRFAEYLATIQKYGDTMTGRKKAIYNAAEITTNFSRSGAATKLLDSWVPYLNPYVQGMDKFFRQLKAHPVKTTGKALLSVTAPAAILLAFNHANPHYKDLDNRTKDTYYLVPNPADLDEQGYAKTFIKIPKTREYGAIVGAFLERMARYAMGEKEPMKDYLATIDTNFAPQNPLTDNILGPAFVMLKMNKDFAGRDIVPAALADRSPWLQYDGTTSEIAKAVGQVTGHSFLKLGPKQIDYLINSYTGVIGQTLLPMNVGGVPKNLRDVIETGIVKPAKRNFLADPRYQSGVTQDFYDTKGKATRAVADRNFLEGLPGEANTPEDRKLAALTDIANGIADLRKQEADVMAQDIPQTEKTTQVNALREQAVELARGAIANYESSDFNTTVYPEGVGSQSRDNYDNILSNGVPQSTIDSVIAGFKTLKPRPGNKTVTETDRKAYIRSRTDIPKGQQDIIIKSLYD